MRVLIPLILTFGLITVSYGRNSLYQTGVGILIDTVLKSPKKPRIYYNLGVAYYQKGGIKNAVENFRKAIELNPYYADALYNLGVIYGNMGEIEAAIDYFTRAIGADPRLAEAYLKRGIAYHKIGAYQRAIKDIETAAMLDPHVFERF